MFFPLLPLLTTVWGTTEGDTSATTDVATADTDAAAGEGDLEMSPLTPPLRLLTMMKLLLLMGTER